MPPSKSTRKQELQVHQAGNMLNVVMVTTTDKGSRSLDLKYEVDGPEIVYKGLDGDERHSRVRWENDSLMFETVEHERGKEIPSKQTWVLAEGGAVLRQRTETKEDGEPVESLAVFVKRLRP